MWVAVWWSVGASASAPAADAVVEALTARHPVPCAEVEAHATDPVAELRWVVDHVQRPPWAPMRAADCLIQHHASEVGGLLRAWVTDPEKRGLGRLVVARLHVVPVAQAIELGNLALERSSEPARVKRTLARSPSQELRALVPAD